MVNWMTLISNAASTAIVAIIGAEYINPLIMPGVDHDLGIKITTISAIVILYVLNMLGIKMSARVLNVLMIIKIALMLMLISAIFIPMDKPETAAVAPTGFSFNSFWFVFRTGLLHLRRISANNEFRCRRSECRPHDASGDLLGHCNHTYFVFVDQPLLLQCAGHGGHSFVHGIGVGHGGTYSWIVGFESDCGGHVPFGDGLRECIDHVEPAGVLRYGGG